MPEKTLQEIPRAWREQYEKGRTAFDRNNLDYAVDLLTKVLEAEPGFYTCRETLRAAQHKRGRAGGLLRKVLGSAPKVMQARMALRRNPLEALKLAEEILNSDPASLEAHKVLADAALAADLPKTARLSLEIAYKQDPKDREVAMKLAPQLASSGQGVKAEAILNALAAAHPQDPEVARMAKDIAASRTMHEGGYAALEGGGGSYRDILRNEQEAVTLEQEKRDHRSDSDTAALVAQYEARLATEPDNVRLLRQIAELYVEQNQFDEALACYDRLAAANAADPALERLRTRTRERRYEHEIGRLDPAVPEQAARIEALRREKIEFQLADVRGRLERYPNDLQLRYELGLLYFEAGKVSEAIQEFQKSQNNPHIRIQSMQALGECFARRRMHDLAARTFENAIKEKPVFDEEKKGLIYALGNALEAMGRKEEAIEQFKKIYEADIAFRDVAARVDAYYAAQGG